jgi:hypothetical protein
MMSWYGRINYNFAQKYLLELSGRYDGSSRFTKDNRWGFFPSVSAGWVISSEPFYGLRTEDARSVEASRVVRRAGVTRISVTILMPPVIDVGYSYLSGR